MNILRISLVLLLVVAQGAQAMTKKPTFIKGVQKPTLINNKRPVNQNKTQPKPQSTAGQMRDALQGVRGTFATEFNRTVEHAQENGVMGQASGLRQEGQALIDDLYTAGEVVQGMAGNLTLPLEVGLELAEENIKTTKKVQSKYKKQALEAITEIKAIAPKLMTMAVVGYLIWTYAQLPARQAETEQPKTKFQALNAWALKQCEPIIVKFGEAYGAAAGKAAAQEFVDGTTTVPTQSFKVAGGQVTATKMNYPTAQSSTPAVQAGPQTQGWMQWFASLGGTLE